MENVYNVKKFGWSEILEPINKDIKGMSVTSKKVLAQAIIYSGMKGKLEKGMFFRSNKDYANDCGIDSASLRWSLGTLEKKGYLKREEIGDRKKGASTYRLRADLLALNPLVEESSSPIYNNNIKNNTYSHITELNNTELITIDKDNLEYKENINKKISINNVSSNSTTMKKEKTSKKKKLEETISGMFGDTTLLEEYEPTIVSSVFTEEDREKLQTIDRKIKKLLKNNNGNSSWEFQVLEDVSDLTDTLLHDKTSLDNYCDTLRDYSYQLYKEKTFSQLKDNVEELVDEVLDALTVQVL